MAHNIVNVVWLDYDTAQETSIRIPTRFHVFVKKKFIYLFIFFFCRKISTRIGIENVFCHFTPQLLVLQGECIEAKLLSLISSFRANSQFSIYVHSFCIISD